jgi:hypothetical protein
MRISFADWQVDVPRDALGDAPELRDLAATRRVRREHCTPSTAALITLLEAQGCFLPTIAGDVALRDVVALFQPIRSKLYADYYAHPLWHRLGSGEASKAELTAWVIHNYHISRSAGVIAARMAMRASRGRLRAFFRDDALDEFWHCDAFYFVDNPNLTLDARKVKAYVPLAASTAFEDVALRAADEDWLGHLLIAYFQESSIIFRHDSEQFYDSVERHYALPGFFAGWRRHMSLDAEQGHADGLKGLFASDRRVSLPEIAGSIRCMQLAHFFLVKALDQIAAHADLETDAVDLRQPASLVKRDGRRDRLNAGTGDPAWGNCLLGSLHEAAFRGLAFARTHDEIMTAGRLSAALKEHAVRLTGTFRQLENPWLVAVHDFLLERSTNVTLLVVLAADILQAAREFNPSLVATTSRLAVSIGASAHATAEQGQLWELLDLCRSGERLPALVFGLPASPSAGG